MRPIPTARNARKRRFSEQGALRTTAAIIGLLSLVALALPMLTGHAGATSPSSSFFDATDAVRTSGKDASHSLDIWDKTASTGDTTSYGSTLAKEDNVCPSFSNSAPGKADIDHFYIGTEPTNSAVFLYLGWTRLVTTGTVTLDFELNQSKKLQSQVDPTCTNLLQPERSEGDLLFTYDFQGTGPFDLTLSVRTWDDTKQVWRAPTVVAQTTNANSLTSTNVDASINTNGTFGEMVLNLTGLGILDPAQCQDFASAYAKSRSSNAFDSSLQDLTDPSLGQVNISNCRRVVPHKVDGDNNNLAGAGFTLFKDVAPIGGSAPGPEDTTVVGTCTTDSTGTCAIPNVPGGDYWLVETTTPNGYTTANPVAQHLLVPAGAGADISPANDFVNPVVPGTIRLTKFDTQTGQALQGAQFGLFADNSPFGGAVGNNDGTSSIATCTTSATGLCQFTLIPPGHYWVKETLTPNGYNTVSPIAVNLPLGSSPNAGATVDLGRIGDNEVPGTIRIHKTDAQTAAALSGATFELFTDAVPTGGAPGAGDVTTGKTCTSDASGLCELTGVMPGDYWAVETVTPAGYATVSPVSIHVGLGSTANTGAIVNVTVGDNEVPGTINVHKIDAQTGDPLKDVTFTLYTDNSPIGGSLGKEDTATNKTCTTDASGNCTISSVALGTYWVVETTTPAGYQTSDPQAVTIGLGPAANTGDVHNLTFPNQEVPGTIVVHKVDDVSSADLSGAEFTLYTDNAPVGVARGPEDVSTGKTCATDASGTCSFTNVPLGTYWVVESKAPTGYSPAADQAVKIHLGPSANTGDTETLTFRDPRLESAISLVKSVNGSTTTSSASPLQVEKGSTLTYKVTVTNIGQTTLTISSLADSLKSDLPSSCTQGLSSTLAPGASFTCTYTSTAAVPAGGGLVVNTAAVGGTDQFGRTVSANDSRQVQVLDPVINIVKTGPSGAHVGDKATYTLTVTNPGNTSLANVTVTDPKCDAAPALSSKTGGNQDNVLDVGETWTYTCSHTVTAADGNQVFNTATATGADVLGTKVTANSSHTTPVLHPAINITKTPSVPSANPGQTVTYTYVVSNPGDTPLSNVAVTDDKCSPVTFVSGDTNSNDKLDTNETWTYTCSNQASAVAGDNTNVGTATGTDVLGTKVTAQATATITVVLAEVITKQTLPFTGAQVMRMLSVAVTLLLLGTFLALTGRKRRQSQTER